MNKTKLSFLALVLISPLLMANSPAPMPSEEKYKNVDVTCVHVESLTNQEYKEKYQLTVKNKGSLYPILNSTFYINDNPIYGRFDDCLFLNEVLPINETKTYTFLTNQDINIDSNNDTCSFYALSTVDEGVSFTNYSIEQVQDKEYKISAKVSGLGDYYYGAIVDVTYDGNHYAFENRLDSKGNLYNIITNQNLDLSKLSIDKITAYRSSYNTYKGGKILQGLLIGFLVAIGVLFFIIPAAIIIPISIVKYKRRKRESISQ